MHQRQEVTQRLREMILRGELAPGQRLSESAIAARLGLSRTPVRQALPALAEEGLLVRAGRRGHAVRVFSINEIITALDIRAALEGMAARLITERGVPHLLVRTLRGCLDEADRLFAKPQFDSGDEIVYGQINERFHGAIVEAADNTMISDLVARLHRVPFVAPGTIAFDKKSVDQVYNQLLRAHWQHRAITEALDNGEGARVEALLREHVYSQKDSMNLIHHRVSARQPS
jgi:GntR family transcriptional regulator of vanillate catabolism